MSDTLLIYCDEARQWLMFRRTDAVGSFASWAEANDARPKETTETDSGPAWTPKSGGY